MPDIETAPLAGFHPLVGDWFRDRFAAATEPQREAWPAIRAGRDVLISAPTGSGKTLAAFLICLDRLVTRGVEAGALEDGTDVVYVSPLKALSSDINRNLQGPLQEIAELARERDVSLPEIRTAVRSGDTPVREREQMARRPPHLLVTTPESLFILLTSDRGRRMLERTRTVIVDEIHAVVDDKRGSHLALTLARLDHLVRQQGGPRLQRIGLSATVRPIERVTRFLTGVRPGADPESTSPASAADDPGESAPPVVVDSGHRRALDLAVEVPQEELGVVASNEMWGEIYDRLAELARERRTTLVFVNTRRLAERVAHHLTERLGADVVAAHHGSLSRQIRQSAEAALKAGELRVVVATASLELGIDVGSVDLVCQIGSPRAIGVALQRVGRSGHTVDHRRRPTGRFFPTTRDELIECAALVRAIREGGLDALVIPEWPRDILAQQVVAAAACEPWSEDALFELVRGTDAYRRLPRPEFDAVITMLSDGVTTDRGRHGAYLHRDRVNGLVRGRRGARLAAVTSGGAIPDNANYLVTAEPEGVTVGTVDEDFAVESMAGDIFLLGTSSWRIRRVEAGRLRVEDAGGAAPSIPFWRGEAPGRTAELSAAVSELRERVVDGDDRAATVAWLTDRCGVEVAGAEQIAAYLTAGAAALGAMPSTTTVVAERFFDEGGGMQLVVHAPFGARVNRAWGLALRKRFCRSFNFELQAAATDNGIVISLAEQHSFPLEAIFEFLHPDSVADVLTQAMLPAPMFAARWRWNASRALAVLRFAGGRKVPPPLLRMRSDDLLASVFPDQAACQENIVGEIRVPDHPLVNETIRDCLHEAMDLDGLVALLRAIAAGRVTCLAVDTAEPSPLSHEILNANPYAFLDDAPLEERRARAVQLRRTLPDDAREVGALDPRAIADVGRDVAPVVRGADELHDALLTRVCVPRRAEWDDWYETLCRAGRATSLVQGDHRLWVATERVGLATLVYPGAGVEPAVRAVDESVPESHEAAVTELLRGWLSTSGPETVSELVERLGLPAPSVEAGLARLEGEGQVLRGRFSPAGRVVGAEVEWCNRRVLARIHRATLGVLRREIEPVSAAVFVRFLARWQHVTPGTRLHGVDGLRQVLEQLEGYEVSAAGWERSVLARRVVDYDPVLLDQLCLTGEVMWGRLSPHPAFDDTADEDAVGRRPGRRVRPTRAAPVALWLRDHASWLVRPVASVSAALSHPASEVLEALRSRGASFLRDIVGATGRLPSEVEDGLWELVAAGLVTADGFDNLRALVDPKRRRGEGRHRAARPRHAAGRWALLHQAGEREPDAEAPTWTEADVEAFARQVLVRWGVVFRDLLARESLLPPWRELLATLRRLEARGEIRGGRFVDGFMGEQFARPEAVDALRRLRREAPDGRAETLRVAAADPLNLVGIIVPGDRVSALASDAVDVLGGGPRLDSVSQEPGPDGRAPAASA